MKIDKNWTQKKQQKNSISKKKQEEVIVSNVIEEKKNNNPSEPNISVITKRTNPKVIINSENCKNDYNDWLHHNRKKHKLLKFACFIIICIIILMTFFLCLKTYNIVNELSYYMMQP